MIASAAYLAQINIITIIILLEKKTKQISIDTVQYFYIGSLSLTMRLTMIRTTIT